jgi:hypothetical protein
MTNKQRRVVCAALRATDGDVLIGIRHYSKDMTKMIERNLMVKFCHLHDKNQGFVDQYGEYMSREEAYIVALDAGQILYPEACQEGTNGMKLYSEGLY